MFEKLGTALIVATIVMSGFSLAGQMSPTTVQAGVVLGASTTAGACTLDGATVDHGQKRFFYSQRTVSAGTSCASVSVLRSCGDTGLDAQVQYQYASCSEAPATPSAKVQGIGFNDLFIVGNAMSFGYPEADLPPNSRAIPLSVTKSHLDSLSSRGVTSHREIVAGAVIANKSYYQAMGDVVKEFASRNMTLIIALGGPVPTTGGQDQFCIVPAGTDDASNTEAEWGARSAGLANIMVDFVAYLKTRSDIDQVWITSHLLIEPFTEFDATGAKRKQASVPCVIKTDADLNATVDLGHGTPKRAATLYRAFTKAFSDRGINIEVVAPSYVGSYAGPLTSASLSLGLGGWMNDYYNVYGGGGRPNIHTYGYPKGSGIGFAGDIVDRVFSEMTQAIPARYSGQVIIGETGISANSGQCSGGLSDAERAIGYQKILTSPKVFSKSNMVLFWRIFQDSTDPASCSMSAVSGFGATPQYNATGNAILATAKPLSAPQNIRTSCSASGTQVTLSWDPVSGSTKYPVRFSAEGAICPTSSGWFSAKSGECDYDAQTATSITVPITADKTYLWWVHANSADSWSGATTGSFSCESSDVIADKDLGEDGGDYCPALTADFGQGATNASTGGQVSELQSFLTRYFDIKRNIIVGTYGPLTRSYVVRFQQQKNLTAQGYVGAQTRSAIASVCSSGVTAVTDTTTKTITNTAVNTTTNVTTVVTTNSSGGTCPLGSAGTYPNCVCPTGSLWNGVSCSSVTQPVVATTTLVSSLVATTTATTSGNVFSHLCPVGHTTPYPACLQEAIAPITCSASSVVQGGNISATIGGEASGLPDTASVFRSSDTTSSFSAAQSAGFAPSAHPLNSRPQTVTFNVPSNALGEYQIRVRVLNSSVTASSCSFTVVAAPTTQAVSCTWNGSSLANGASVVAYQTSSVANGSACASQVRTCTNGALTGSYTNASCSAQTAAAPWCTLSALPAVVSAGGTASLSWITSNASSARIAVPEGVVIQNPALPAGNSVRTLSYSPGWVVPYTMTVTGPGGTASCSATVSMASATNSSCVPAQPQTQTTSCPSGQTGTVYQMRTSYCPVGATSPSWNAWTTTSTTCVTPGTQVCPSGQTGTYPNCVAQTQADVFSHLCPVGHTTPYPACLQEAIAPITCSASSVVQGGNISATIGGEASGLPDTASVFRSSDTTSSFSAAQSAGFAPSAHPLNSRPQTVTFNVPSNALGEYQIRVRVLNSSVTASSCSFTVVAAPTTQAVSCTPAQPQTQTTSCPSGQTGVVTQTRTSYCPVGASTPLWNEWTTTGTTCVTPVAQTCAAGQTGTYPNCVTPASTPTNVSCSAGSAVSIASGGSVTVTIPAPTGATWLGIYDFAAVYSASNPETSPALIVQGFSPNSYIGTDSWGLQTRMFTVGSSVTPGSYQIRTRSPQQDPNTGALIYTPTTLCNVTVIAPVSARTVPATNAVAAAINAIAEQLDFVTDALGYLFNRVGIY